MINATKPEKKVKNKPNISNQKVEVAMDNTEIVQPDTMANFTKELVDKLIPIEELEPKSIAEVAKLPSFFQKMQECERLCNTKYSEIDQVIQDALVFRRLQQMINTLMLNPLWKERIEAAGISKAPGNLDEWQQLPITDKTTVRDFFMGTRPGLVVPLSFRGFEIVASGGTSGGLPLETVYSLRELQDTYKIAGDFMGRYQLQQYLTGDDPKWVITTLADYQMWSSGTMVGGVLQNIPKINYIGAGPVMKEVFQHMLSYKGPKALLATTQGISILSEHGKGLAEEARASFRVALYGSGVLPHRKQIELKALYPNLNILSYFAATQAETIGLQLMSESPVLTAVPGLHFIEIVDADGRWVDEGEEGELIITRLHAHEAPLLRFKLGDRMIRRPLLNGSGLKSQQFEFSGRSGDVIHIIDTHYVAPQVYTFLCSELIKYAIDLNTLAHEVQFVNNRKAKLLTLLVSVDDVKGQTLKFNNSLGKEGLRRVFIESLVKSLSIFNALEANAGSLEKTEYQFEINLVALMSGEIFRTEFGKTPLIRDLT